MSREIQEYWYPDSSLQDKQEIFNNQRSWSDYNENGEWERDDDWDEKCEDGHIPEDEWGIFTKCSLCNIGLVRMNINGKKVFIDPNELVKLNKWNEMTRGGEG